MATLDVLRPRHAARPPIRYRHVLVPLTASAASQHALEVACELAADCARRRARRRASRVAFPFGRTVRTVLRDAPSRVMLVS